MSLLLDMFSALVVADEEGHPYLSVVVSFARHFAEDLAGILPRKQRLLVDKFNVKLPEPKVRGEVMLGKRPFKKGCCTYKLLWIWFQKFHGSSRERPLCCTVVC